MTYQLNQQLELPVRDLRFDLNTQTEYAVVYDDEREYRIYNILECQKENLPDMMFVKVDRIKDNGSVIFRQDESKLFPSHYQIGKMYTFDVKEIKIDINSDVNYYVLEDDFSSHRFYYEGEQLHQTGDSCILEVTGFTDKGFLKLAEVSFSHAVDEPQSENNTSVEKTPSNLPILDVTEDKHTELKTSIVFSPDDNGEANIGKQLFKILKEITAFMNTDGGTLYIGIHDKTKCIVGIKDDYAHLNDDDDDYFNGKYKENNDGYELKIRNAIDRNCPSVANSLIDFSFEKVENAEYCKIVIGKARRPIWLNGNHLYIRQGNRIKSLKGDEITMYVYNMLEISIHDLIDVEELNVPAVSRDFDKIQELLKKLINERRVASPIAPPPPSLKEIDYWIVWNDDATWRRQRDKANDASIQVPVYKNMSNPLVVLCYSNNRINVVKLSDLRKGVNLNTTKKNGWSAVNGKPMNIFIAEPSNLVVIQSIDSNSISFVKLHALTDFTPTASAGNAGAPILPDASRVVSYSIISSEHRGKLQHLICPKNKRSQEKGTPLSSPSLANEIDYLSNLNE